MNWSRTDNKHPHVDVLVDVPPMGKTMKPCTQCGRCCTNERFMGSLQANAADLKRWRREKRSDILQYAFILGSFADLWISPRTGDDMNRCPFVRKVRGQGRYTCTIYETRPQVCRDYPNHVSHMQFVDCEMLEPGDTDDDVQRFMSPPSRP